MFDYIVVGAGLFGSTFARMMEDNKRKCLVIDSRDHVGGNLHDEEMDGITVQKYGPHIFHADDSQVWEFANRFTEFNGYRHSKKVSYKGRLFSFPINLLTLNQVFGYGVDTPEKAKECIKIYAENIPDPKNFEEWVISQVGEDLYKMFYKGYTKKQWGRDPKELAAFVAKRLPIRFSFNDSYFDDEFQGIPIEGYAKMFERMLDGIDVQLENPFDAGDLNHWLSQGKKIIYTGPIDEFFGYKFGELEYRTLDFQVERKEVEDFQGCSIMNFTGEEVPYTRISEYKHFSFCRPQLPYTYVAYEYPRAWTRRDIPYYPVNDAKNNALYEQYKGLCKEVPEVVFGGRLGSYKYYDMDDTIVAAIELAFREINNGLTD